MTDRQKKCKDLVAGEWKDRQKDLQQEDFEGLCFDYVEANTLGTHDAYHRYQMSWGGPQDEIRFYVVSDVEFSYKVTYAFLDWYDSAEIDITDEAITERFRKIYQV